MNIECFCDVLVLFSVQRYAEQVDIKQSLIEKSSFTEDFFVDTDRRSRYNYDILLKGEY